MRKLPSRSLLGSLTFSLSISALTLGLSATTARALDDGDDTLLHELTSVLGMDSAKSPDINYRDQAPLVLPPKGKTGLPVPKTARETPHPAWPNDPDVLRAKKEAAKARAPTEIIDKESIHARTNASPSFSDRVAPTAANQGVLPNCVKPCDATAAEIAANKYKSSFTDDPKSAPVAVGQEPDRDWLTEPPKGFRKVTRNVNEVQPGVAEPVKSSNPLAFWKWFSKDD